MCFLCDLANQRAQAAATGVDKVSLSLKDPPCPSGALRTRICCGLSGSVLVHEPDKFHGRD